MIEAKWDSLLKKLDTGRGSLSRYHDLMAVFADMDDCLGDMAQIEVSTRLQIPSSYVTSNSSRLNQ